MAAAAIPVVGNLAAGVLDKATENPAGLARNVMQGVCVIVAGSAIIYGYRGWWMEKSGNVPPPTFYAGSESGFTGGGSSGGSGGSGSGGSGSFSGTGKEMIAEGLKRAGLPSSWANSAGLWNILEKESSSTPQKLQDPVNSSSGALGPFQLNPSSGTAQQYGVNKDSPLIDKVVAGLKYIRDRYGTPERAWSFWQANGWY